VHVDSDRKKQKIEGCPFFFALVIVPEKSGKGILKKCEIEKQNLEDVPVFESPPLHTVRPKGVSRVDFLTYCTISINSAGPVTRDGPAEILVSATSQSCRDMPKNLGIFGR